jgi:hypothetical protein
METLYFSKYNFKKSCQLLNLSSLTLNGSFLPKSNNHFMFSSYKVFGQSVVTSFV